MPKINLLVLAVGLLRCALLVNNNFEACASPVPSDIYILYVCVCVDFPVTIYMCGGLPV